MRFLVYLRSLEHVVHLNCWMLMLRICKQITKLQINKDLICSLTAFRICTDLEYFIWIFQGKKTITFNIYLKELDVHLLFVRKIDLYDFICFPCVILSYNSLSKFEPKTWETLCQSIGSCIELGELKLNFSKYIYETLITQYY